VNDIFKKLNQLNKTIIFFDEVDELVKARNKGGDVWIVTTLLPKFQELWNNKNIKFILATNDITKVDWAITRTGRIDFVLPMGALCWIDRVKLLKQKLQEVRNPDNEAFLIKNFKDLFTQKDNFIKIIPKNHENIKSDYIKTYLHRTNFIMFMGITDILSNAFSQYDSVNGFSNEFFQIFFDPKQDPHNAYENLQDSGFKNFHELEDPYDEKNQKISIGKFIMNNTKLPPKFNIHRAQILNDIVFETVWK